MTYKYDVFISHASEDKLFVKNLAKNLETRGFHVWYDEFSLECGDDLLDSIDKGLEKTRYGIVVLSPTFFKKQWTQYELKALARKERNGQKAILPIWHKVEYHDIVKECPTLADKLAVKTSEGMDIVVDKIARVLIPYKYYDCLISRTYLYQTAGVNQIGHLLLSNIFVTPKVIHIAPNKEFSEGVGTRNHKSNFPSKPIWYYWDRLVKAKENSNSKYHRRSIVLLGAPNLGKTTFLRYLSWICAVNLCSDTPENTNKEQKGKPSIKTSELIPVLLLIEEIYQEIVENKSSVKPELFELIAKQVYRDNNQNQFILSEIFKEDLKEGRCLVLLDGLDKVGDESKRKQFIDWLDKQIEKYKKNIFILTSRPFGYVNTKLKEDNVGIVVELQPLEDVQVNEIIYNWYEEINEFAQYDTTEQVNNLKAQIENSSRLKEMVDDPWFLIMICYFYYENRRLPEKSIDFFQEIHELLLKNYQINGVSCTVKDIQSVLQVLALELMKKQDTKFKQSEGIGWIKKQLASVAINLNPEKFIKHICEIGLLVEYEEKCYKFALLSFQEYLAACQIKESNQEEFIINMLNKPGGIEWWLETIFFFCQLKPNNISTIRDAIKFFFITYGATPIASMAVFTGLTGGMGLGLSVLTCAGFGLAGEYFLEKAGYEFLDIKWSWMGFWTKIIGLDFQTRWQLWWRLDKIQKC